MYRVNGWKTCSVSKRVNSFGNFASPSTSSWSSPRVFADKTASPNRDNDRCAAVQSHRVATAVFFFLRRRVGCKVLDKITDYTIRMFSSGFFFFFVPPNWESRRFGKMLEIQFIHFVFFLILPSVNDSSSGNLVSIKTRSASGDVSGLEFVCRFIEFPTYFFFSFYLALCRWNYFGFSKTLESTTNNSINCYFGRMYLTTSLTGSVETIKNPRRKIADNFLFL